MIYILTNEDQQTVDRTEIVELWREFYPRHVEMTGERGISRRVAKGLLLLRAAGVVEVEGTVVKVLDLIELVSASSNLSIIEDAGRVARPPSEWLVRPVVPVRLRATQDTPRTK